ncbi:uncharacterized protein [Solanum lycopersicum]|uniref:uncharacterized protein n=1 Tax=Solanum lycopersicum TaxID=4081 RepID=UPI00374A3BAB
MYHDLIEIYWWESMKKGIAKFVAKFPNGQQVKVEYQKAYRVDSEYRTFKNSSRDFQGLIGQDLVHQAMDKLKVINERFKIVSPMKDVMRFDKKGKICPRYIGPYRISKRICNVAYRLELPQELAPVHPVFHISMLKKCMGDPLLIVPNQNVWIKDILSYKEILVQILDLQVRKLKTKEVASVKILWTNQFVEEATWEDEEDIYTSL